MNQNSQRDKEDFSSNQEGVEVKKQANTQIEDGAHHKSKAIAVIGIGCRFPGANDYEQFWLNLEQGVNSISEIPPQRWDVQKYYSPNPQERNKTISKWSGLIEASDEFDAQFFGISPREAKMTEPQQRLMLELSWSCLEDAGYSPSQLSGSPVGVFIGACNYDSILFFNQDQENIEGHLGTGTWTCMIPNRISYFFDFRGPSVPIDTACSSSLVALHLAIHALKEKECEIALVGGISVLNTPTIYIQMSKLGMLSPTGQCQTFDSDADGYVRGEGAGIILLKPLAKAIEDQDHIYGVIKGSAVNHSGKSRTLTSPNIYAQAQVVRAAYTKANVAPNTVSYIEAHGTGTPLGDPIEINALKRGFRQLYQDYKLPKAEKHYCGVGTVKTNIGHLEGAAGIAGVIKILLAMKQKKLPKILNFKQLNPRIDLDNSPFYIVSETQEWQQLKTLDGEVIPRRAGVSSFGIGGVNAHVVLEEAPEPKTQKIEFERPLHILTLSAKNEKALGELVKKYQGYLQSHKEASIANICFTANTGRAHFEQRLAVVAESNVELQKQLEVSLKVNQTNGLVRGQARGESPKVGFIFTGEGSQYVNMGWQLYQTQPRFRQTLEKCDQILRPYLEKPLLSVLYPQSTALAENSSLLERTTYTQPALFAIEYALAQLWQSWGIKPDVVMGYSVGEYVAATVAGVLSLEDGLRLIATRARLMESISGEFEAVAREITYNQPRIPLISYVTGQQVTDKIATPEYWTNHIRQPVHFGQSMQTLHQEGYKLFLEIGPKPILLDMARQCVPEEVGIWLPSLHPLQEDWQQMLSSLGQLYTKGVKVDWSGFDQDYSRRKVALPTYPFQRQRYWLETSENGHQKDIRENSSSRIVNLLNQFNPEGLVQDLNLAEKLTEEEQKLLPKLLKILINQHSDNPESSEQCSSILQQLEKTPQREHQELIIHYLQGVIGKLLGFHDSQSPDLQLGFFDMGMNYSTMLELRNILETNLGCSISVTTLFEHFNIQQLAKYLINKILVGEFEEKFEIDNYENQQTIVDIELKPLCEDAIANAIKEELIATALQDELKEIQLLLNQEI
ncbi:MAG: beta-ketoacyl synthase N-terminal-like domain-containing protein [Nostoc sp.]|uniref:type I polyketide synthase n=1 Tax=Nostoc sp. TaxID=1180 RepID=UPI002FF83129